MKLSPEQIIQRDCVKFTHYACPDVLLIASMNGMYLGGLRNVGAYIARMKILGMRSGDLDLRLHWSADIRDADFDHEYSQPMTAYVELKAGKNPLTQEQKDVMAELNKIGIPNHWTNTLEGYIEILRVLRVPMRRVFFPGIGWTS